MKKIIIGDEGLAEKVIYCPNCGTEIDFYNYPPNYCANCGSKIEVNVELK